MHGCIFLSPRLCLAKCIPTLFYSVEKGMNKQSHFLCYNMVILDIKEDY